MSSLMTLSCATLVIPAAYHSSYKTITALGASGSAAAVEGMVDVLGGRREAEERGLLLLSRGTAIILFLVYIGYLFFQLKTHADLFEAVAEDGEEEEELSMGPWSAGVSLAAITVLTSFCAGASPVPLDPARVRARTRSKADERAVLPPPPRLPDILVSSIDETCQAWNIPKAFVGLILLPLVGNAGA